MNFIYAPARDSRDYLQITLPNLLTFSIPRLVLYTNTTENPRFRDCVLGQACYNIFP